jgi:hypothetical protein
MVMQALTIAVGAALSAGVAYGMVVAAWQMRAHRRRDDTRP